MKKTLVYCVLLLAAATVFCLANSESARIKRRFRALSALVEKRPGEPVLEGVGKSGALADYLAHLCIAEVPSYNLHRQVARDDFAGAVLVARGSLERLRLEFADLSVSVADGIAEAEGSVTLDTSNAAYNLSGRRFSATLVREDGGAWVFSRISVR